MDAVDIFSGAGGFSAGAKLAGARVLWAANHWPLAISVHKRNHPETEHACQDLHEADWASVPAMDLLTASPSCQGHSNAASRGGTGVRGSAPAHDKMRATAWAVVSCLEVHRPPFCVVENVGEFRNWILYPAWRMALGALGYAVAENVVDAADVGVPQHRKRLFLTVVRGETPFVLDVPRERLRAFGSFIDGSAGGWEPLASKPAGTRERAGRGIANFPGQEFLTQHTTGHPGRSLERPIGTITTKHQWMIVRPGRNGHEARMLTLLEYRRAMGFPDDYWLPENRTCDSVKLLGNAVCPPVARWIIEQIKKRG